MKTASISAIALCLAASTTLANPAGYAPFGIEAPHHNRGMIGAIWYPSQGDGRAFAFADSPVFHGVTVVEEATVAEGVHPVVVLSHGMGGNIRSLAWLAAELAQSGAIVVSVNHPNSTWGDFDLAAGLEHWTRVQDLSVALDALWANPQFAGHLDESRIMAAGFSYGGWTALSMGGLTGDHAGYVDHCATYGAASSHCDDLMGAEINLAGADSHVWDASHQDPRITHVTAIDPGLTWGLDGPDTAGLIENVRLIGLGGTQDRLLATDFDASGFASLLPNAQIDNIAPAMHFMALPLCKPLAEAILIEEQDDPVCTDPEGSDRQVVHATILARMRADLGL
jgi:predicted dienelactone hydrolase